MALGWRGAAEPPAATTMFSKRARYALHGVGFLAYHHPRAPVPFAEILSYLEDYSGEASLSAG